MSVWCGCTDKAAHASDPHPEPDWVLTRGADGHVRPQPVPPQVISRAKFRELAFQADLAYLTATGPDSLRVKAAITAVLGGLGYVVATDG